MSEIMRVDGDLERLFRDVFTDWRDTRPAATLQVSVDRDLWRTLEELGLTRLTSGEEAAAGWVEAAALLRAAAGAAAPVPLAEHDLLAGWLLDRAGLPGSGALRTGCLLDQDGSAERVPWAASADAIVVIWGEQGAWKAADVPASAAAIEPSHDLAGQPRDTVRVAVESLAGVEIGDDVVREYSLRGALARTVQITGAMDRIVELCLRHASERRQFGRPITRFQAVQHLIAEAASECALAMAATDAAVLEAASPGPDLDSLEFAVAAARSVTGHAASVVVRNAHQVHGAIGTTFEHRLHEFTKPALAWRSEFGSMHEWDARLTALILGSSGPAWDMAVPAYGTSLSRADD
ncbi:acyl-CoA dehydrogenase family protein [Actinomadura sp. 6K520]|uniref:acyl-CoA dehydrogenase family protein n=1 Tax=Actinomadura sp. 6K520 TaxID=2530364 RepID=UPI00105391C0|nr:acyl-CoA dehydrogenase family protein [Actinomadura sp. 6K520]TDE39234.1 acyl-CoA dehydrogenase [Actinomadura sp. 6K520]